MQPEYHTVLISLGHEYASSVFYCISCDPFAIDFLIVVYKLISLIEINTIFFYSHQNTQPQFSVKFFLHLGLGVFLVRVKLKINWDTYCYKLYEKSHVHTKVACFALWHFFNQTELLSTTNADTAQAVQAFFTL